MPRCRGNSGYDANILLNAIRANDAKGHILSISERVVRRSVSRSAYRQCNLVERFLNKLAAVALVSTCLWITG